MFPFTLAVLVLALWRSNLRLGERQVREDAVARAISDGCTWRSTGTLTRLAAHIYAEGQRHIKGRTRPRTRRGHPP